MSERAKLGPGIWALLICAGSSAGVSWMLSPKGPLAGKVDLSFFIAPLLVYIIFRCISREISLYLNRFVAKMATDIASALFSGLAFGVTGYLLLGQAAVYTSIPPMEGFATLLAVVASTAVPWGVFVLGWFISYIGSILNNTSSGVRWYSPGVIAIGNVVTGIGLWQSSAAFNGYWSGSEKLGIVLFVSMVAVAITKLGAYRTAVKNLTIRDMLHWLNRFPESKFILGGLITAYVLFIRPFFIKSFSYAPLIEWCLVCFIAWRIFSGIDFRMYLHAAPSLENRWNKHMQVLVNDQGDEISRLSNIQTQFIDAGNTQGLTSYVTDVLRRNRFLSEEAVAIMQPLIEYRDSKLPWYAFGIGKKRVARKNINQRKKTLAGLMDSLKSATGPAVRGNGEVES